MVVETFVCPRLAVQIEVISTYVTFVFPDLFTVTVTFSTEHELKQMSKWMEHLCILTVLSVLKHCPHMSQGLKHCPHMSQGLKHCPQMSQ